MLQQKVQAKWAPKAELFKITSWGKLKKDSELNQGDVFPSGKRHAARRSVPLDGWIWIDQSGAEVTRIPGWRATTRAGLSASFHGIVFEQAITLPSSVFEMGKNGRELLEWLDFNMTEHDTFLFPFIQMPIRLRQFDMNSKARLWPSKERQRGSKVGWI